MSGRKNRAAVLVLVVACILSVVGMTIALRMTAPTSFEPPPFESGAQTGMPEPAEGSRYTVLNEEGLNFTVGFCASASCSVSDAGAELALCFASPVTNLVWMKARITDGEGTLLGETGILCPGQYVEYVQLTHIPADHALYVRVMTYEPETYYSNGAVTVVVTAVGEIE